jgi:hypothetical protein
LARAKKDRPEKKTPTKARKNYTRHFHRPGSSIDPFTYHTTTGTFPGRAHSMPKQTKTNIRPGARVCHRTEGATRHTDTIRIWNALPLYMATLDARIRADVNVDSWSTGVDRSLLARRLFFSPQTTRRAPLSCQHAPNNLIHSHLSSTCICSDHG